MLRHISLSEVDASHLWNWVLAKQGLSVDTRLSSVTDAAEAALGLHAARLPSPFATAVARTAPGTDLQLLLGPLAHPELVTVRCMRKTLHTLPIPLAAVALAATRHYRFRDAELSVRKLGLHHERFSMVQRWLLAELENGPLSPRELESRGAALGHDPRVARAVLKYCWEDGQLIYRNGARSWHREDRRFSLTRLTHPELVQALDPEASKDALVQAYFQRYGPATLRDASWWSGLGQQRIGAGLSKLDVITLQLPWAASPFYMLADDYDGFLSAAASRYETGFNYLAHEDVALKAYFESRDRYLGGLPPRRAFNSIGEVLPTILWNGQVVGVWRWDSRRRSVRYRHFPEAGLTVEARRESRQVAADLGDRLCAGHLVG